MEFSRENPGGSPKDLAQLMPLEWSLINANVVPPTEFVSSIFLALPAYFDSFIWSLPVGLYLFKIKIKNTWVKERNIFEGNNIDTRKTSILVTGILPENRGAKSKSTLDFISLH